MSPAPIESRRDGYVIRTDPARLDLAVIHRFLAEDSYWAKGIPREVVERSVRESCCFGLFEETSGAQVGFARVITDYATFGYLGDVFVLPPHRGRGLSKWLVAEVLAHPDLQGFRRWMLATRDAHGLYAGHGFTPVAEPAWLMQIHRPDVYASGGG
ncbi:MAG: GNAT family N-acetyltransferase [Deltaproteobacteria bacterium]|nr:GNAT family N-acetyltransferase [Deltaproteobacteria bacterium]